MSILGDTRSEAWWFGGPGLLSGGVVYICPTGGVLVVVVACETSHGIFSQSNGSLSFILFLAIAFSTMEMSVCKEEWQWNRGYPFWLSALPRLRAVLPFRRSPTRKSEKNQQKKKKKIVVSAPRSSPKRKDYLWFLKALTRSETFFPTQLIITDFMVGLSVLERCWRIKTILLGLKFSYPNSDILITCLLKSVSESQG